ncbi:MAG: nicotinamide-nucleotide amidohydrolase family protein [Clostridia bacterium]|nr:nicotinamide-nucleotide amidohydrolase family protein [Clostridia bacterium]
MKTALILFSDKNLAAGKIADGIAETLFKAGLSLDFTEILSPTDDLGFKHSFERFRDTADNLIVADGAERSVGIKGIIADISDSPLFENETAKSICEENGGSDEYFYVMPINSTPIPNRKGAYQGFMTEDPEFTLAVLPPEKDGLKDTLETVVVPYLAEKAGTAGKVACFGCFGGKKEIETALSSCAGDFGYELKEKDGDVTVAAVFKKDKKECRDEIREIAEKLSEFTYADSGITLSETLFTLLKINSLKISVAESFTAGRIAAKIVENAGASSVFTEGIACYSDVSKVGRLGVKAEDIVNNGAVSSVVAYQMAAGLLNSGNCDIAVATTGLSGPDGDGSGKPVGLCYIAVGTKDGVHTYKMNLKGDREKITATAVNAALFLAVKNIRRR